MAIIGTGNMGGAIVRAVCRTTEPSEICIANRTPEKAKKLADECGCVMSQSNSAAARIAKYVVLGVKPDGIAGVLEEIAPVLTDDQIIVSMAVGVSARQISRMLGKSNPVVRILPNTPCAIGKGEMLIVPGEGVGSEVLYELRDLFSGCGRVGLTDEAHAEAAMAASGCTPAFTYMFIEALADGAVATGLTRAQAIEFTAQAVLGAAAMVLESGCHPGQLKDEVCSPGGTTIQGVRALEERGFRAAAMDAVISAWKKSLGGAEE
jgi:pyrroline-5-carboxylate reductase